jgi:hypothetical protein
LNSSIKKRLSLISLVFVTLLGVTSCASSGADNSHSLTFSTELWPGTFEQTEGNNCKGVQNDNYRNNADIVLLGPDGNELSASNFSFGTLTETVVSSDEVTNFPKGRVCLFEVVFEDVPEVATYRVKFYDGTSSPVSHSKSDLETREWRMMEIVGADFKE